MRADEASGDWQWWKAITTSKAEKTRGGNSVSQVRWCLSYAQKLYSWRDRVTARDKASKQGGGTKKYPYPSALLLFSLPQVPPVGWPSCTSSQPESLADAVTRGQFLGLRIGQGGRRMEEAKVEEPAQCDLNKAQWRHCLSPFWLLAEMTLLSLIM